ncbi:MAG TPA: hypothetical protein VF412_06110 [Bdellovibrio sp.]|uniref:hypothetical protein n=1 Tax=Bdellovibrio sp. TaxID=28201 RepID=UPI002EEB4783
MKILLHIVTFFALTSLAWAGDTKRNGGVVIKCRNSISVFDLYEGKVSYDYNPRPANGKKHNEIVQEIINTLSAINPSRAALYQKYLTDFSKESSFAEGVEFSRIDDLGEGVPVPENCQLMQAAVQFRSTNPMNRWYLFSQSIWNQLDEKNKAALILHEFIYRAAYAENNDIQNSIGVRHFNSFLQSDLFAKTSLKQYLEVVGASDFALAEYKGIPISPNAKFLEFADANHLITAGTGKTLSLPNSRLIQNIKCDSSDTNPSPFTVYFDQDDQGITSIAAGCKMRISLSNENRQGYIDSDFIVLDSKNNLHDVVEMRIPDSNDIGFSYLSKDLILNSSASNTASIRFGPHEQVTQISMIITSPLGEARSSLWYKTQNVSLSAKPAITVYFNDREEPERLSPE